MLKGQSNEATDRDLAVFLVLLHTGLRVSELLSLERDRYDGKAFNNVKGKGKVRLCDAATALGFRQLRLHPKR